MTTSDRLFGRNWNGRALLTGLALVVGIGLVGIGSYYHLTVAAQVSAGRCDGCEPWHPLLVLAPLGLGSLLVTISAYLGYRR